ncbi:peroxynitrite isomerase THAP4 [Pelodytes ibericus]
MVICCAAPNCTNRQGKGKRGQVSFHRFPLKDPVRLTLWTAAVQRSDWSPGPYSFLCSEHFSVDSFISRMPDQSPLLRPSAVPTLFPNSRAGRKKRSPGMKAFKKKLVQKSHVRNLPTEVPLMSHGEDILTRSHESIFYHDDLQDTNCLPVRRPSACTFINSLHSYSRSSLQLASQEPGSNVNSVPHISEMSTTDNGKTYVTIGGVFTSGVPKSGDHLCPVQVKEDPSLLLESTTMQLPLQVNMVHCESTNNPPSLDVEEPGFYPAIGPSKQEKDQLASRAIESIHSYSTQSKHPSGKRHMLKKAWINDEQYPDPLDVTIQSLPPLDPAITPLGWMLGTWVSEPVGEGEFPTITPFQYKEEATISHVGQPMLNFTFCASNAETGKPLHRECGFIRIKPGTNQVAFICAQNIGVVEIEEGEIQGEQLSLTSHSLSRISFAKKPTVQQISRTFRLTPEGKLEQTVSMATSTQPLAPHLRITYRKLSQ